MQSVSKATKTVFTKQGRTLPCFLYDSLVSTNDEAKRIIREGGEDCFAVCALEQTGGRGRYSRPFLSLRGKGLYITFSIRADEIGAPPISGISPPTRDGNGDFSPEALAVRCATFGALSSLAVAALLEELFGVVAEFKWPNDVLACGRKIAGILSESVVGNDGKRYAVVGMGVNLFYTEEDFGKLRDIATSAVLCAKKCGLHPDFAKNSQDFVVDAAVRLAELCARLAATFYDEDYVGMWSARLVTLGRRVRFTGNDSAPREGVASGVGGDCSLLVRCDDGEVAVGWGEVVEVAPR